MLRRSPTAGGSCSADALIGVVRSSFTDFEYVFAPEFSSEKRIFFVFPVVLVGVVTDTSFPVDHKTLDNK